jgi:hypothetical protein
MYFLTETKMTEDINMNVSQIMLNKASPEEALNYLRDSNYQFKESGMMYACAKIAGTEILSFQEVYGNPPHHRYDQLDLEGMQMDGHMQRVNIDPVKPKLVDVSTGELARAAHKPYTANPNEIELHLKGVTKSELDNISQAVSGSHYNDVVPGYQYMEMMQHMLDGKEGVESHLLGQVYKYLMRAGKKDDVEQEYRKARWYLNCLVKFKQTGEVDPNNND